MDASDLGLGPVAGSCKHDNEILVSIKDDFIDHLCDCYLPKKDYAQWSE
jgi:hypothetical protein